MFLHPTAAISLLRTASPEGFNISSLRSILIGGATISEPHIRKLRDQLPGKFVFQGYGQSEVGGLLTLFKIHYVKENMRLFNKPHSVGKPLKGLKYKVTNWRWLI